MSRARVTSDDVSDLVKRLYGIDVTTNRKLPSYDDINYHVSVTSTSTNKQNLSINEAGYVLKILNTDDSKRVAFLDAMHAAIEVAYQSGIVTSRPVKDLHGNYYSIQNLPAESGADDCEFVVRLFEYVPGDVLKGKPYTPELCWQVGQLAGKLDKALSNFSHPGLTGHKRYWSLTNVPDLRDKIHAIHSEEKRRVVESAILQFEQQVTAHYDKLKRGTIHADFNHENIIVMKAGSDGGSHVDSNQKPTYTVHGIIDFGDLVQDYPLFELGIVLAYMITFSRIIDPLEAGGHVLAGFLSEYPIPTFDCDRLMECVAGRLSQSLVNGEFAYKQNPANLYCLESSKEAWPILERLNRTSKHELYSIWERVLGQYGIESPFPSNALDNWVKL